MSSEPLRPINLGVVGLSTQGWAQIAHYPALAHPSLGSTFQISATHTSSERSAKATAEAYNSKPGIATPITTYYGSDSPSQIARDPNVDVVVVSVKVPNHKAFVDAAIEAGKPYFVEYPPARNLAETLEILRKTEEKGLAAVVGLQGRHSAPMRKVHQIATTLLNARFSLTKFNSQLKLIIDSGKIGKILSTTMIGLLPREAGAFQPELASSNEWMADPAAGS